MESEKLDDMRRKSWFELMFLARNMPVRVESPKTKRIIKIANSRRLVLLILANHADGLTNETTLLVETICREAGLIRTSVDKSLSDLKEANLLRSHRRYNRKTKENGASIWTVNREQMRLYVGATVDAETIRAVIRDVVRGERTEFDVATNMVAMERTRLQQEAGKEHRITCEEGVGWKGDNGILLTRLHVSLATVLDGEGGVDEDEDEPADRNTEEDVEPEDENFDFDR